MNVNTEGKPIDQLMEDWSDVLESEDVPKIEDKEKLAVTARLLENQDQAMLTEAPTMSVGDMGAGRAIDTWNPILISMIRRSTPKLIAFDIFGVQPMSGPTGLIFAMRSRYDSQGEEALYNEPNSGFSAKRAGNLEDDGAGMPAGSAPIWEGKGTPDGTIDPNNFDPTDPNLGYGIGMSVADLEGMGDENVWNEMSLSIEKSIVEAKGRGLRATWSNELSQDLKAVHGLNAGDEIAKILSTEIMNEQNREMVRRSYVMSMDGAQDTTVPGTFDLNIDSDGRWAVEKHKGLIFQIEKEQNKIAFLTKRGKGNFIICSANVASALAMTGLLDTGGKGNTFLTGTVDTTGTTFVGMLNGRTKVFVDPFVTVDFICTGYKGVTPYDAAAFFCPYVPLTMYKATTEEGFQPRIGFKTRYGFTSHPFSGFNPALDGAAPGNNRYLRIFKVANL